MKSAVICAYARSPFTPAMKGELTKIRPDDLVAEIVAAMVKNSGINADDIEDLLLGCAFPEAEQGFNMARNVVFIAKLPVSIGGATINRFCGSSMQSIHMAAGAIATGAGEVFICAGVESMTRIPMGGYNPLPNPTLYDTYPQAYMSMGLTAEEVAKKFNISRKAQEEFALKSHQKAAAADFSEEIIGILPPPSRGRVGVGGDESVNVSLSPPLTPPAGGGGLITRDGCIRTDASLEKMAELKPVFDVKGSVTAATSSPLTDGAAATLVCSEDYAKTHNLPILARIKATAVAGVPPEIMGIGPVEATRKVLARAGLTVNDLDVIELNEAFAAQSLACIRELGLDEKKINLEGGAIALGHPLGASGARITGKAAQLLHKTGGRYALATQCIGGGQGIATVLERV